MIFSSVLFLFLYLPLVLLCYYIVPRRFRNCILFLFSLLFYGWGEPIYIVIMLFSTLLDYMCGHFAHKFRLSAPKKAKAAVITSVIINLGMLGFFKYANFFIQNINTLFATELLKPLSITLPIGISFYTFQSMSYTIDVYRGDAPVQRRIIDFGAFITLFPQLIAGPIVRYSDISNELNERCENTDLFAQGITQFIAGLGKKVLLANNFGLLWDLYSTQPSAELSILGAWIGIIGYAMQIYFDFSGYSDMAIGLGKLFGFHFPRNFNYPYTANSITDFWRRWHITLSTWFREYVYIPLGGNRKGPSRTYLNLFIVWMLTGFWHGASWNFIAWGVYFAVLLILEKWFILRLLERWPGWLRHVYTLLLVLISWVLFSIETLPEAFSYIGAMFGTGNGLLLDTRALHGLVYWMPLMIIGFIGATPFMKNQYSRLIERFPVCLPRCILVLCIICLTLCTAYLVDASYNPFLYFRF